jgi:hypothetical protein
MNQLAKLIVDISTGEVQCDPPTKAPEPKKVSAGRRGGLKGGKARARALSPKERSRIAKKGAAARWGKASAG